LTTPTSRRPGEAAARLARRVREDPVWFSEKVLGIELWSKQRQILRAIRDNRQVAVRSCHGPGKTKVASVAVMWMLYGWPESRVVTTATKWSQVKALLWHEVNQNFKGALLEGGLGGVCLQTELKLPDGRYAIGLSTRPGQEESFQGHHAPNILLLYDEASGVPVPVYEAGEGYMTTAGARKLMIGNPTRAEGDFYKAFTSERDKYRTIHISAFDTPAFTGEAISENLARHLVSRQWVEERRNWEGTALWDIKVLGEFSKRGDDNVIALHIVEAAQAEEVLPIAPDRRAVIGVDVARFGSDETVISVREGRNVRVLETYHGQDTTWTTGAVIRHYREIAVHPGSAYVVVDDTGVGGGVTDQLRAQGIPTTAFEASGSPYEPEEFPNRRSELWFEVAKELPTCSLPVDEQLASDLVAPKYKIDGQGRRVVEPKEVTKKRLGRSPDKADSVNLTFVAERSEGMEIW
jgi:phage terminase large subunit